MKKVLALVMALMMLGAMGVSVFAANNFLTSPGQKGAPELVDYEGECNGDLIVVSYKDRYNLPKAYRTVFEEAYNSIVNAKSLGELCKALLDIAKKLKIADQDLIVSDFFYIYMDGCTEHTGASTYSMRAVTDIDVDHGPIDVTLEPETVKNFVALMNYKNGEWHVVEDATVTPEGYLNFTMDTHGPFAIVTHTSPAQTGDSTFVIVAVSCLAVVAAGMVVVLIKTKKRV